MSPKVLKRASLVILVVHSAALALSMRYSRIRDGDIFAPSTAVLMVEILKFTICLCAVYHEHGDINLWWKDVRRALGAKNYMDTLKVGIPSFLYVIQNNLLFVATTHLDAATYQVTYQLKILWTALCAIHILDKKLTLFQWTSLLLLVTGVVLVQLEQSEPNSGRKNPHEQNWLVGFLAAVTAGALSSFAGVYFERTLKSTPVTVWMRNAQLSFCSIPVATVMCYAAYNDGKGFFFGFDTFVGYLITLQACGGLLVALVVKYADNILKGFATSLGIILTCLVSSVLLDFKITTMFLLGVMMVVVSVFLYGYNPPPKAGPSLAKSV